MDRSAIHNYYEHLVFDYIHEQIIPNTEKRPDEYFLDIACVALNKLPTRYISHDVDMAFFLEQQDQKAMEIAVRESITEAISYIDEHIDNRG